MHQYDELLHERSGRGAVVERAIAGDEDAFHELYEQHAAVTWRFAYALTGTTRDAVGVVSESFARTFTALRAGRDGATEFSTLLLHTARHLAIDVRRSHGDSPPPFEANEHSLTLARAFASLPERWRSALWLSEVEDQVTDQTASIIDLDAVDTAEITRRARKGLREQYLHADVRRTTDRNCGRAVSRLGSYIAGTLSGADVEKLERHLSLCPTCTDRCEQLDAIGSRLSQLVPPLPAMLEDDARIAWTAAVATTSGLGLTRFGEKVLAGVVAVAAGVAVFGAAVMSVSESAEDAEDAAPVTPIVTELALPRPDDIDLTIDLDPSGADGRSGSPDDEFDGVYGASARNGDDGPIIADIGGTPSGSDGTPGNGGNGGGGITPPTIPTDPGDEDEAGSDPVVSIGADLGGVPVAVDVGSAPGATVGPISVGSEPEPGQEPISVAGPLAPLAPVVQPISGALSGVLGN